MSSPTNETSHWSMFTKTHCMEDDRSIWCNTRCPKKSGLRDIILNKFRSQRCKQLAEQIVRELQLEETQPCNSDTIIFGKGRFYKSPDKETRVFKEDHYIHIGSYERTKSYYNVELETKEKVEKLVEFINLGCLCTEGAQDTLNSSPTS